MFLYDKADKKLSLLKPDGHNKISSFVNDVDSGIAFTPFYLKDDIMYQIIDAMTFIEAARESGLKVARGCELMDRLFEKS